MGAENICSQIPVENRSLIDWLSWTVKTLDVSEAIKECGLGFIDFQPSKSGGMGYKQSLRCGNIVVFFDGAENMGCHFSLTGQGCRQYEAYRPKENCWFNLLLHLHTIGANFTRVDLATDNVDGALDLDRLIHEVTETKNCQSRFRDWHRHEKGSFSKEIETLGKTLYLGSPTSRIKMRFYDKAAQLQVNAHWVRCEIQCMKERANEAINRLLSGLCIGSLTVGILNNYFRPINSESENKCQCSTQSWWAAWLTTTEKIRLTTSKAIKLVEETIDHIKKQYSASFAMVKKYLGVASFHEFVHDLTSIGKEKLTKKHEWIIQSSVLMAAPDDSLVYPF